MKILLTGQCSLHWGRMEFGNIGNYYIIEPFIRELHKIFPGCEIRTTLQMSERFCSEERVSVLPLELFYGWTGEDLIIARKELDLAKYFSESGELLEITPYLEAVIWADMVIDFSGDLWGDNADFLGADRFEVGLLKDRVSQLMGKRTVMLAGSPGPFSTNHLKELARKTYGEFDLVTNREAISTRLLEKEGFDCSKTVTLACPAFLFEPLRNHNVELATKKIRDFKYGREKPVVGFVLCGWNFANGPFDMWPRDHRDYTVFAEAIEFITESLNARVCLMSHSNGFAPPPAAFRLEHGRDYPIAKQLQSILLDRGIAIDVISLDGIYDAWETKAIIGSFDMLVSGRIHAAVAGLSQNIPTIIIDYGHEPKAHKLRGFANIAGIDAYVADPSSKGHLNKVVKSCWKDTEIYRNHLRENMPKIKAQAKTHFELLKNFL